MLKVKNIYSAAMYFDWEYEDIQACREWDRPGLLGEVYLKGLLDYIDSDGLRDRKKIEPNLSVHVTRDYFTGLPVNIKIGNLKNDYIEHHINWQ